MGVSFGGPDVGMTKNFLCHSGTSTPKVPSNNCMVCHRYAENEMTVRDGFGKYFRGLFLLSRECYYNLCVFVPCCYAQGNQNCLYDILSTTCLPFWAYRMLTGWYYAHYSQHAQNSLKISAPEYVCKFNKLCKVLLKYILKWGSGGPGFKSPRPDHKSKTKWAG